MKLSAIIIFTLQYKTSFYAAGCVIDDEGIIRLGYVFVDMIKTSELTVASGTGEQYRIKIPKDMQSIPSAHQFNYSVEIIK